MLKKILALLLAIIMLLSLVACNGSEEPPVSDNDDPSVSDDPKEPTDSDSEQDTEGDSESTEDSSTESEEDSETADDKNDEPDQPDDNKELVYPWAETPKTLKILAIGNSFSKDAMEYVYNIAKSAGVETVILGNMFVSGCTISLHFDYAKGNNKKYEYFKNTSGTWKSTKECTFYDCLLDEDWDYITLQQGSHESGLPNKYRYLTKLIDIVESKKTNPDAKLLWHMTWAYPEASQRPAFANHNNSQIQMYNDIVQTVQDVVIPTNSFYGVIPSGTAVQNARTSFMGDTLNRDDFHMSIPFGRYLVGLTYYAAITGADISDISYRPSVTEISKEMAAMAKESVKNAMLNMFSVTESSFKESTSEKDTDDTPKSDAQLASELGIDLSKYTLLEYEYLTNQYYISNSSITPRNASSSQNGKHICFKERYTKEQLLNAIIICDAGWQYRPEVWKNATDVAANRPGMCSEPVVLLDEAWWGTNTYFALNISANPQIDISADYSAAAAHVRIYVLK